MIWWKVFLAAIFYMEGFVAQRSHCDKQCGRICMIELVCLRDKLDDKTLMFYESCEPCRLRCLYPYRYSKNKICSSVNSNNSNIQSIKTTKNNPKNSYKSLSKNYL
uniref:Uncharacterized protein n=1 Tax=Megaselia scalaris TaxID=36166 RepID=T1GDJ0_MEGSC